MKRTWFVGFTLAELLIALGILGIIATFAIPKILITQQNARYNAETKEIMGALTGAYQNYASRYDASSMYAQSIYGFLNNIAYDTTSSIDAPDGSTIGCNATNYCMKFANGVVIRAWSDAFCDDPQTAVSYTLDLDGVTGTPQNSIILFLYRNGAIRTKGSLPAPIVRKQAGAPGVGCNGGESPDATLDPIWFSY